MNKYRTNSTNMLLVLLLTISGMFFSVEPNDILKNNLIVGTCNGQKGYQDDINVAAVAEQKQIKEVVYNATINKKIRGVCIYDQNRGAAEAHILNGGVGYDTVSVELKSPYGEGMRFHIDIYVE